MEQIITSPANTNILLWIFYCLTPIIGVACFTFIIAQRIHPLVKASPDFRCNELKSRFINMLKYAVAQYKHPRYKVAGILHIIIFAGFCILSLRSITLVIMGIKDGFTLPGLGGSLGTCYNSLKDVAATAVLVAVIWAAIRRGIQKPQRYKVPEKYGKDHTWEAVFVLILIGVLMLSDMIFEGSHAAAYMKNKAHIDGFIFPLTGTWFFSYALQLFSVDFLQFLHIVSYTTHELTFFFFLCFLPLGKHFHVITSMLNVFFMKINKGTVKPVQWGISDDKLDDLESFGVKKFEDFTWKHMLDFYSCADCGRCSDQCPANAVGRPLSPRFITIKSRDYCFSKYPIKNKSIDKGPFIGKILEEDEIWSCTTCGACEEECPLMIEYIDKIVDLRRGLVDEGKVPQSIQKPLGALEKRGNPYGKTEKKRVDWIKSLVKEEAYECKIFDKKGVKAKYLFFVDSVSSYDDRMQEITKSAFRILKALEIDFGILGPKEKDSGNEVRRFGEEMLFQELKDQNTENILKIGVEGIITADPHAYNSLKNDYENLPPIKHISQVINEHIQKGKLKFKKMEDPDKIFVYHDPCYLGRHNQIYQPPRDILKSIPNLKLSEMEKNRDRSFCCGGGGLMLFYEPVEETRMGKKRVEMANDVSANTIVTACPFCMANIEDGIKTSGLEGKMTVIDLVELVDMQRIN